MDQLPTQLMTLKAENEAFQDYYQVTMPSLDVTLRQLFKASMLAIAN
jgi:hypothetical protein